MTFRYAVYGLCICADSPIPGLFPNRESDSHHVAIHLRGIPASAKVDAQFEQRSEVVDHGGQALLRVARSTNPSGLYFRYSDETAFLISDSGSEIWAEWCPPLTLEDTATYLLGPMLGFVLRLRGVLSLHASVVEVDGQALGFMGAAGAGKSTLAAALAQKDAAVMSDDILALELRDGGFFAQPGYPRLRLWPDSAKALFGTANALPKLTPNWDKRYLALDEETFRFQSKPVPLSAIYVLGNGGPSRVLTSVEKMKAREAMLALLQENGQGMLLSNRDRAREFAQIAELVRGVPVKRLCDDVKAKLPAEVAHAILEDFATTEAPSHV
jgi:hypothetical protein